jgi:hypothetical protein
MAQTIPTTEPTSARCGDTWQWRREDLADFPASLWTLTYYFRSATAKFDVVASSDGAKYAVTVAKATTAALVSGVYDWLAVLESATERFEADAGRFTLLPNLAKDALHDGRSFARRMLEAIEAALESRATGDQLDMISAGTGDRNISRDKDRLMQMRTQFKAEVKAEDDKQRLRNGGAARNRMVMVG